MGTDERPPRGQDMARPGVAHRCEIGEDRSPVWEGIRYRLGGAPQPDHLPSRARPERTRGILSGRWMQGCAQMHLTRSR